MLLGFFAAFGTALFKSASDITFKLAGRSVPDDEILLLVQRAVEAILALSVIVFGALLYSKEVVLPFGFGEPRFWITSILAAVLSGFAFYLTIKALRISDISLVSPMAQLTPLILLVTSPLMLGERLTTLGELSVIGIILGSYCVGLGIKTDGASHNPLRSFSALFRDRGVQYALIASFIYGITSNLDKIGVTYTSPVWWVAIQSLMVALPLYAFIRFTRIRSHAVLTSRQFGAAVMPSTLSGAGSIMQMIAISVWPVPYVIAVKRLGSVITVVWGALFFGEKNLGWRMLGSLIMVASTIMLVLFG